MGWQIVKVLYQSGLAVSSPARGEVAQGVLMDAAHAGQFSLLVSM